MKQLWDRVLPTMGAAADHAKVVLSERLNTPEKVDALAERLGLDRTTVYNWRSGRRGLGPDDIAALVRAFGDITADELLGLSGRQLPPSVDVDALTHGVLAVADASALVSQRLTELRDLVVSAGEGRLTSGPLRRHRRPRQQRRLRPPLEKLTIKAC